MNTKFNLGVIEIKIPAGEDNPEINVAIKDVSAEVTDMSITEYAGLFKVLITEGTTSLKEIFKCQEEAKQKEFERDQTRHDMAMKEISEKRNLLIDEMKRQPAMN